MSGPEPDAPRGPEGALLRAPAKVNLGLRVTGRRPDGYHELDALFVPLDLADALAVEAAPRPGGTAVSLAVGAEPGLPGTVPAGGGNLAARAVRAFCERAGLSLAVRVRLHKRIPAPGGLGGGSSDAAAVLRALAARFPDALPPAALADVALALGADVPFFLGPGGAGPVPARVRGIGERVEPVAGVPALWLLLAHPRVTLETARVYAALDAGGALTAPPGRPSIGALLEDPGRWRAPAWWRQLLRNDLEAPATCLCPALAALRARLEARGATAVGLSGSGPTFFGIFPDALAATDALDRMGRDLGSTHWLATARTGGAGPVG